MCGERKPSARRQWQVFRANSHQTQIALVASWVVGLSTVGIGIASRLASAGGATEAARLIGEAAVATFAFLLFAGVQLRLCRGEARRVPTYLLLALGLIPLAWGIPSSTLAFGCAAALVTLSARGAACAVVVSGLVFGVLFRDGGGVTSVGLASALLEMSVSAIVLAAITHLAVLANRLRVARELLARRHVDLERDRIGRHLHDVLGRTLVAASLRNQTILRTIDDPTSPLAAQLERLQETIMSGQQRIRAVASGPAIASWSDELSAARMLCQRVGIDLVVEVTADPPASHRALVGLAIRESVTNVLKHSRASFIDLSVAAEASGTRVRVINNGVRSPAGDSPQSSRLRRAVEEANGRVTMGVVQDGHYRVEIHLPDATPDRQLAENRP